MDGKKERGEGEEKGGELRPETQIWGQDDKTFTATRMAEGEKWTDEMKEGRLERIGCKWRRGQAGAFPEGRPRKVGVRVEL